MKKSLVMLVSAILIGAVVLLGKKQPQGNGGWKVGRGKRRIAFIEVGTFVAQIYALFHMPRLGPVLLATILKKLGYETKVFVERKKNSLNWAYLVSADAVCISTTTETAPRAYRIADKLREKNVLVIMGGVHATACPEEALKHCSVVVRQEGDETLPELLKAIFAGMGVENVRGISYRSDDGRVVHNSDRSPIEDQDDLPVPDFSLIDGFVPGFGWQKLRLVFLKAIGLYFLPLSSSRGCPYGCTFCSVLQVFGRKYRAKTPVKVIEEMEDLARYTDAIFFVDDNVGVRPERLEEVCYRKLTRPWLKKLSFTLQVRAELALKHPELVTLLGQAGCTRVYIGFESADQKTLEAVNKKQQAGDMKKVVEIFQEAGIKVHGMFVIGFDTDDKSSFDKTLEFAREIGADTVQFLALSMLPGTEMYAEMKAAGRLIESVSWEEVDGFNVTFRPKQMSPRELQMGILKITQEFYNRDFLKRSWRTEGPVFALIFYFYVKFWTAKLRGDFEKYFQKHQI